MKASLLAIAVALTAPTQVLAAEGETPSAETIVVTAARITALQKTAAAEDGHAAAWFWSVGICETALGSSLKFEELAPHFVAPVFGCINLA